MHFTVLGFTAANGDPLLWATIFAAKTMKHEWVAGFDPLAEWISDEPDIEANSGDGKAYPYGPVSVQVIDCSTEINPFLLLDEHGRHFELEFLVNINFKKTKWEVNIGLPCGTSLEKNRHWLQKMKVIYLSK